MTFRLTAPCHFGLEKILAFEIKRAGGYDLEIKDGRINFSGDEKTIINANICCSVAERIGILAGEFTAETFDDIFDNIKNLNIGDYIGRNDKFPVTKGHSVNSKLTSIPALQRTVKKALVLAMQEKYKQSTFEESGSIFPFHFLLMKDKMTLIVDTSGDGLHKRGYRAFSGAAPIKETLAAGIADLARVRENDVVVDPFCGSGTILIEAAMKAAKIPPCLNRGFVSNDWDILPKKMWEEETVRLRSEIKKDTVFKAYGFDIDDAMIKLSKDNSWKAGTDKIIEFSQRDIKNFSYPEGKCKIICNPPYAERLLEKDQVEQVYREMGRTMLPLGENQLYLITSHEQFEELFGQKSAKNRKLYNGMLKCRLYSYL